jgi:glycosyltransferase involved in cell wall biosynthesis
MFRGELGMKIMIADRNLEGEFAASWYYLVKQLAKTEKVVFYGLGGRPSFKFSSLPFSPRINHKLGMMWFTIRKRFTAPRIIEDVVKITQRESSDVILMRHPFLIHTRFKNINQVKTPKVLLIGDFHRNTKEIQKYVEKNQIDLVLFIYKHWMTTLEKWIERKKVNAKWLPHCVNTKVFHDYGSPRKIDVVSSGFCEQKIYPFRVLIRDTLRTIPDVRFLMPKHPKFELAKGKSPSQVLIRENYARFLSQSKIFIFGSSIYNYALMKYTEGMACNTLVMAPMPTDGTDLHFVPDENFVEVNQNNFLEKIRYYLKHDEERRQIALRGVETISKYHTVEIRARQLVEHLKSIL